MTGGHPNAFVAGDSFRCSGPRPRDAEGILPQFGQAFCGSKFDVHREWRARLRPSQLPQELRRQQRVAVLVSLALLDAYEQALGVNVDRLEMNHLADAQ